MLDTPTTSFIYKGFSSPNGTIVPDDVFDVLLPQLTDPELRVLLYIIRKTFGWKKDSDNISLNQMVHGVTARDGRVLDGGAGLSKASAARGIQGLVKKGIIKAVRNVSKERGNEPTTYQLRFEGDPLSQTETRGGLSQTETTLVSNRDTQQTPIQTTDIDHSNIRKSNSSNNHFVDNSLSQPLSESVTINRGMEDIGEILTRGRGRPRKSETTTATNGPAAQTTSHEPSKRSRGRPRKFASQESQAILELARDFGRDFSDHATVAQSAARLENLFNHWGGGDMNEFLQVLYQAKAITRSRNGIKGSKFAYFCSVVEDLLGLKDDQDNPPLPN